MGSDIYRTFRHAFLALLLFAACAAVSNPTRALTINSSFNFGSAPGTVAGDGDFVAIFNTAASLWESAILDDHTVDISFGWGAHGGSTLASASVNSSFTSATITFDNDGSSSWFLDPTPTQNGEWDSFTESSDDLGGGVVNTGRVFRQATGDASGRADLLSVALHEIGHAIGFVDFGSNITDPILVNAIDGGAFDGTSIATDGSHIDIATAVLFPSLTIGQRRLLSDVDILGTAAGGGYTDTSLAPVPVPAALWLLLSGLLGLLKLNRRQLPLNPLPAPA
jgi:hypothetical protein